MQQATPLQVEARLLRRSELRRYDRRVQLAEGKSTEAKLCRHPTVVFAIPPLASVGLSEREAASRG